MRGSEWVLIAYFAYTSILARILPLPPPIPNLTLILNLVILAGYLLLAYADSLRRRQFLGIIRDWFPFPLMLLAYREMGWFAQPHHSFALEHLWVTWDRVLFYRLGVKSAVEILGPLLPALLEICYSLVYSVGVFAVAMLYVYRRRDRVDRFLFSFELAVLLCYVQFPFWPSEPPRTVFPGADFPTYDTVFRHFNWWLLGGYGMHTSVFPSAHVAGAFSVAFAIRGALPEKPWLWRFLFCMAIGIATATVYGRYHYLADATAGFAMSLLGWAAGTIRNRRYTPAKLQKRVPDASADPP